MTRVDWQGIEIQQSCQRSSEVQALFQAEESGNMWTWNLQIKFPSLARKPFGGIASLEPLAVNSSRGLLPALWMVISSELHLNKSCNMEMGFDCVGGEPCAADAAKVQSHGAGPLFAACSNIQHNFSQ
jgi:hypothetical protein